MTLAARALREYAALARVLPGGMLLRLLAATLANLGPILRTRTLTALDAAMSRNCAVRYHGCLIQLPLAELDGLLAGTGDNPVFGNLREMFANDVYLRAFPQSPRAEIVVDLGANRGLFQVIAHRVLGAGIAVGVEPEKAYRPALATLCRANAIAAEAVPRLECRIAAAPGPDAITLDGVMARFGLPRIDVLKCDIEGAEYDLFATGGDWLAVLGTLVMELHPGLGDNRIIVSRLEEAGLAWLATDRAGRPAPLMAAEFLYASRAGDLPGSSTRLPAAGGGR